MTTSSATVTKGVRMTPTGTFEAAVTHKLLPNGRITRNFATQEEAVRYRTVLLATLDAGVTPPDAAKDASDQIPIAEMLERYRASTRVAQTDKPMVEFLAKQLKGRVTDIDPVWADRWVRELKVERLAPGTIRKRVECLARALEWWHRTTHPKLPMANPLRGMPRGYSTYGADEVGPDETAPKDVQRDRRLRPGEEERIEAAITGWHNPERERRLTMADKDDFLVLFKLLVNTGLRLREAYQLRPEDVDLEARTIVVQRSKTATGAGRIVPMNRAVTAVMSAHMERVNRLGRRMVFPWSTGSWDEAYLRIVSGRLSSRFRTLFDYVGSHDLKEHDLRHEAVCRWMTMKAKDGSWLYRPEEVRKIVGHKSDAMLMRYLSLRGSDLVRD